MKYLITAALGLAFFAGGTTPESCLEQINGGPVLKAPPRAKVPLGTMPTRMYGSPELWACRWKESK